MVAPPLAASAPDASAAVVGFLGSVLVAVAAAVFGFYAAQNRRLDRLESQGPFWRYLVLAAATAGLFGAVGVAEIATDSRVVTAVGHGALLLCIVFLALSMREVYYGSALAPPPDEGRFSLATLRRVESAFLAVIAVEWLAVVALDQLAAAQLVKAGGALAFAAYGAVFAEKLEAMSRGTPLDTLRRHLLPVLICLGAIGVVDIGTFVGAPAVVVDGVRNVFVVLVAGFLITATIRLQQNVEGLSAGG